MKIVYIAHPISGDVEGNLKKILAIVREINLTMPDVIPFAHYWVDCHALDDTIPEERLRGIKNDKALLKAGFINELWLYGDRISSGMSDEIETANELGMPVVPKSKEIISKFNL
jgi:hypothetical protein